MEQAVWFNIRGFRIEYLLFKVEIAANHFPLSPSDTQSYPTEYLSQNLKIRVNSALIFVALAGTVLQLAPYQPSSFSAEVASSPAYEVLPVWS